MSSKSRVASLQQKVTIGGLASLLAALAMLGPFSVDTYLPAFPNIMATLHASDIEVQQTLTAYMLSFAVMILWHGALSDAFGRRNIVLIALGVFAVASFGCASAHSIQYLWGFRILQGISAGAGIVVGRAIIRDLFSGPEAEKLLSLVTMIFSIAPAIAPIVGGLIVTHWGWRAIFLLLFAYTVIVLLVCVRYLPESLPRHQRQIFSVDFLWQSYRSVFKSPLFLLKSGTIAFNFAGFFVYIASAPVFITEHLKLGPADFGWQFIPSVAGIFLGALSANQLAGKISVWRQVNIGFAILLAATVANVGYHLFLPPALPWSVIPLFFYAFGMSLVAPGATLLVLDLFPGIRGVVASCQSFVVTLLGAIVAGIVAPAVSHSMLWLCLTQLGFALCGFMMWYASRAYMYFSQGKKQNAWESIEQ